MKLVQSVVFTGAGLLALANVTTAQESGAKKDGVSQASLEEVIVTARRKEERLEDVPSTVNVATAEDLNKLNIRSFQDIATIMPGLNLAGTNVVNATASVRGITFNQVVSGNSGVIEFYLNDSPVPSSLLYQVMYDIGQVELLRGPQGTLRGRAAPAGSMTVTTRRPDLSEFGGYVNATATDIGGYNANGAINIPIVSDKLAVRIAALWDENEGDRVHSINNDADPFVKTKSARATVSFEPLDSLSFLASYQYLKNERQSFIQVEHMRAYDPSTPLATPAPGVGGAPQDVFFTASDHLSVQDTPAQPSSEIKIVNLQGNWSFLGQRLSYVGQKNTLDATALDVFDVGNVFGPTAPSFLQGYGKATTTKVTGEAHELRLSSEERIFSFFDYSLGAFYEQQESPTSFTNATFIVIPAPPPTGPGFVVYTPLERLNFTKEQSYFGNLTAHLGTGTELSAGMRHIDFSTDSGLLQNGVPNAALESHQKSSTDIFMGSVKQRFTDDLMAYILVGSSWRPPVTVVGDFNTAPSPLERSFINLAPEESTSYELGIKASFLDKRMTLNAAYYHQEYENNPWRSPTPVYYVNTATVGATPTAAAFNLAGAVPVTIDGVEAEWSYAPFSAWDMSANASYADGKIKNGVVPCNDYLPHDGIPDTGSATPTLAQIQAAAAPETITGCTVNYPSSQAPMFSASAQTEVRFPMASSFNGYARGLLSYYGDSQNDPTNPIDDVDSYSLLNLYVGIRAESGSWEVGLYGKNVTETERVLSRTQIPLGASYRLGATPTSASSNYRTVSLTSPREFGINVQYSFGSR